MIVSTVFYDRDQTWSGDSGVLEPRRRDPGQRSMHHCKARDLCKANDLCFYSGEKFDPTHVAICTKRPQAQVNALAVNDLDIPLTEEVIQQLLEEDSLPEQFGQLSLHAIAGTEPNDAIRLQAKVRNKTMLILVDSGSSHSFVNSDFLTQVNIVPIQTTPLQVQTANGHTMVTDQWVPDFTWWCQGHTLKSDMKVLQLGAYDAILGFDWLQAHSPMKCDWQNRTMEFTELGKSFKLQGIPPPSLGLQKLSASKLMKLCAGNEVSAFAIVDILDTNSTPPIPAPVQSLLQEFDAVFQKPINLPPVRIYDHTIPLVPNALPVNSKPYRYSPLHKDEIERQVKELLSAGLITHSTSPFASPVLLVQKKDGSWHFCVDYRKLNALTVKNRFPLPIIKEILD